MNKEDLQTKIEDTRKCMYEAYNKGEDYNKILNISQQLDDLLNRMVRFKSEYKLVLLLLPILI
ncbi:aspartyl-phosphate phosphatase Spo0E family protein [Halobacillus halophilus]|uniref:aspartyl-phosphate phosphatase Spo0E family protein n=1 Tax=Halobacillus halophilus TaxID=1570 RepID=UPI001CD6736B|nr:aspartyl-phosphate phosphatase Spo0E family protein [Halobacillus halophilus]MCA1009161.1 aspartyl-phosphate phosphatase Spo0E family protein [Halobacillus halophilus]